VSHEQADYREAEMSGTTEVPLSPRAVILAGMSPEALAVGYSDTDQRWVTAAERDTDFEPLPRLDGVVLVGEPGFVAAADDFGHIVHRRPSAVLRPGSRDDVAAIVQFARAHAIRVGPRGQGHTNFGQSQIEGGVHVEMGPLSGIGPIRDERVEVDGGVTWAAVLRAALAHDLAPPVLTDYLDLSVAGTLSVGGVGGTSWRHGAQVDSVDELSVVTGEGALVRCSETRDRDLFEAVLAGQGQCGLIVGACLRLAPAPSRVRVSNFVYPDVPTMTSDIRVLIDDGRFDYVVGFIVPGPGGWTTLIEAVSFFTPPASPDPSELAAELQFIPGTQRSYDASFFDYAYRVSVQYADLRAVGLQPFPNPWIDLFLPGSQVDRFVVDALQEMTPADLGRSWPILLYPFKRSRLTRPMLRVPDEEVFFLFDVLRAATPGATDVASMIHENQKLYARHAELGGRFYPIGAVRLEREDWQRHFQPYWDELVRAKRRFDPDHVLTPGPGIF
jgi:cytokinin dehydrogenase